MEKRASFATGIPTLDHMLGGKGIEDGSIVLVRGGPGSGKTTLSLQMLAHHLAPKSDPEGVSGSAVLLSLESPPEDVLRRARSFFPELPEPDGKRLLLLDRHDTARLVLETVDGPPHDKVKNLLGGEAGKLKRAGTPPLFIIDSLGVFLGILGEEGPRDERGSEARPPKDKERPKDGPARKDMRSLMHAICRGLQDFVDPKRERALEPRPIVILIAEHHPEDAARGSLLAESFMCDTEILLTSEPLPRPGQGSVGQETHTFCRVTKSRSGQNQVRRCCYEIVPNKGLVFYETFPGDGRLLLFHENEPQRKVVKDFFGFDVPQLFPGLQYESFDRASLHHVLDNQRRFHQVPGRTDMYLASFDTYWINWYVESNQRMYLSRELLAGHPRALVGLIHRYALEKRTGAELVDAARRAGMEHLPAPETLHVLLEKARAHVESDKGQSGIFELLPWDRIRLFGSRRSAVIPQLAAGPHRLRHGDKDVVRSVPYNFNLGYFVYRKDLLDKARDCRKLSDEIRAVCAYRDEWVHGTPDAARIGAQCERVEEIRASRDEESGKVSFTWEEAIALAVIQRREIQLEMQLFDTFLATALELVWAHGGELRISPDYQIVDWEPTCRALRGALALLNYMLERDVVRPHSSRSLPKRATPERDWLFARHWHSTLIDVLTTRTPPVPGQAPQFAWSPDDNARLEVAPIPTTALGLLDEAGNPQHVPCLGEWHLALLKGSENKELGYDIINWLVGSQSIGDQAACGAMLPTAEYFYRIYGDARCVNVPERPSDLLPSITFNEVRALADGGKSRSTIFDYRRTMRELHGVLQAVRGRHFKTPAQLWKALEEMGARPAGLGSHLSHINK
jgi:RecA/RadA recombinase